MDVQRYEFPQYFVLLHEIALEGGTNNLSSPMIVACLGFMIIIHPCTM